MKAVIKFQGTVTYGNRPAGGFWIIGMQDEDNPRLIYTSLSGSDPIMRRRFLGETGEADAQRFADKLNNNEELTDEDLFSWLDGWEDGAYDGAWEKYKNNLENSDAQDEQEDDDGFDNDW